LEVNTLTCPRIAKSAMGAIVKLRNVDGKRSVTVNVEYNQLDRLTIPDSVIIIGEGAFSNNQLRVITLPSTIRTIANYAFSHNQLDQLIIPDSVEIIGSYAFMYNQLREVIIPDSVEIIGFHSFSYNQLRNVTLPRRFIDRIIEIFDNVTNIIFTYTD
jgi:hypothetical protein